jgi:hypothetical protein
MFAGVSVLAAGFRGEELKCGLKSNMLKWCGPMGVESKPRKATLGFLLAIIAGVFVLLNGLVWFTVSSFVGMIYDEMSLIVLALPFLLLGVASILFAIAIFLGAFVIYWLRKAFLGGVIVLVFSVLSILVFGGFLLGALLGIVGGAFSIWNKQKSV